MSDLEHDSSRLESQIAGFYDQGRESTRLSQGLGRLEFARTQELLRRYLPIPPAVIFDVGGGAGVYAFGLAEQGYEVHLIDASALHIQQAKVLQVNTSHPLASIGLGDARKLDRADVNVDAVLLLGPLYHLVERADRIAALREAARLLKPGGVLFAAGISRFASALSGLTEGLLDDDEFVSIMGQDLKNGQHRNPNNHPKYFTTAFLHHPDELISEIEDVGLRCDKFFAIEGLGGLLQNFDAYWDNEVRRERLLTLIRATEEEPTLIGASSHFMVVAKRL